MVGPSAVLLDDPSGLGLEKLSDVPQRLGCVVVGLGAGLAEQHVVAATPERAHTPDDGQTDEYERARSVSPHRVANARRPAVEDAARDYGTWFSDSPDILGGPRPSTALLTRAGERS